VIEIAKLPLDGLRIEGSSEFVPLEEKEAMRGLSWQLFLMPTDKDGYKDIFFDIRADAVYEGFCCRCLEPVDTPMALRAQFLGSSDPNLVARGSYMLGAQDLDVVYLPEDTLDEAALVAEQFVLQRPMHALCAEGCKGLCPQCGKNLNKGQCGCRSADDVPNGALARALAQLTIDG
jgi:uncharacterized protein